MQSRLRSEINATIPDAATPSYQQLESLQYLDHFVKEVMRYYSPSTSATREAAEDVFICGTLLPAGTIVEICPAILHFNTAVFGPTAAEFDPDRWGDLPEAARDPFANMAFLAGPRVCIGKSFAILEIKAIVVDLVRSFEFESSGVEVKSSIGFTLKPEGGLKLKITEVG